jgi:MFS family permease
VILGALTLFGVLLAWLLGADLRRLALVRLRASWVVFVALAVQLLLFTPASRAVHLPLSESSAHVLTYAALLAFVLANLAQPGFAIAALGCGLNAAVIVANGGRMPVSLASWTATGRSAAELTRHGVYNNVALAHGAHLAWLGDVFPLPRLVPLTNSLSIGDLLVVLGVATFAFRASLPAATSRRGQTAELLAVKPFRRLLLGRTVSRLGDWLTMTAVVTWLYVETRSSLLVSLFLVVRVGATVVGGVLAAPLLDRFTRFRTLWFVEVVRGVLMLATIPFAATGSYSAVTATVAVSAALSAATDPCAASLVPELLPARLVHAGNALHGVMRNVMMVAGTLVGGVAVAKLGMSRALLIDVATFALAAVLYRRFASAGAPAPEDGPAASRVAVLTALVRQPVALGLTASFTVVTAAMAILNASLPAFFDRRLGDVHAYGYGMGAIGAGLLCGEALSACVRRDSVARRSVALAFLFCGGAIFVLGGTTAQSTAYLFLFLLGASDGTTEVVYDTLFQARFPRGMLAGAFAAAAAIQRTGMIVGFLLAPVLLAFGWMTALEVSGAVCLAGGCLAGASLLRPTDRVREPFFEAGPAPSASQG